MDNKSKDPLSFFLNVALLIAIIVGIYAYSNLSSRPPRTKIHPSMMKEPQQSPTTEDDFTFSYKGTNYEVTPVAEYELWGLVVTHNDTREFSDIYHNENSVDIKDICVIWGKNLNSNNYQRVKFYSEPWSCIYQTDSQEVYRKFSPRALSNSHLLSDLPKVREKILSTKIGDQIHLKGMLVNYFPENSPSWVRKSSTSRDDTGNGACEVVFVEEYEILKSGNQDWWSLYNTSFWVIVAIIGIKIIFFIKQTYCRPSLA